MRQAEHLVNQSHVNQALGGMEQWNYQLTNAVECDDHEAAAIFADHWKKCYLKVEGELSETGIEGLKPEQRKSICRMANNVMVNVNSIPAGAVKSSWKDDEKNIRKVADLARGILVECGER